MFMYFFTVCSFIFCFYFLLWYSIWLMWFLPIKITLDCTVFNIFQQTIMFTLYYQVFPNSTVMCIFHMYLYFSESSFWQFFPLAKMFSRTGISTILLFYYSTLGFSCTIFHLLYTWHPYPQWQQHGVNPYLDGWTTSMDQQDWSWVQGRECWGLFTAEGNWLQISSLLTFQSIS